ncbi:glycosyltransferase family 39 protein [Phycisphaera mikurensis]|uniref:Glycosyltransferase RgtA/B/C/D-like domain-containing protein n=1 Tax=Phycisphaera mikurensis (strain NBRC 102666 / KCTC 22515 / FYK2301M01) TaxID=1142394 RepID=I0ICA3_PHYMF|nr:glycosyltransferase family 39 protein [Phycisphaera mikurensis]MBB6441890.1 hypothetical protein [Phycisphaera mikurensis]BAM02891.1 hypothetical protein PSMK_07320 [Phycisphaera mikurensis NBRC 102666]
MFPRPRPNDAGGRAGLLLFLPVAAAWLTVVAVALSPVEHLSAAAAAVGANRGGATPPGDLVAGLRVRAAVAALPLALLAGFCLARGARITAAIAAAARREVPRLGRSLARGGVALPLAALTGLLAARLAAGMDTPLRTDEAATLLSHGEASPLVILSVWKNTNNHLLHSLLLRGSVAAFGESAAAARFPAAVAATLCVPALFLAARAVLRAWPALAVAALFAGSAYAVELGTNARGHPLVLLAACLLFALVPRIARGRPGAAAGAAVVAAAGAWAVPLMLLPFAAAVVAVLAWPGRASWMRRLRGAGTLAAATGTLVFLLYLPPLLVRGLQENAIATVGHASIEPLSVAERFGTLGWNLRIAWRQMAFPLGPAGRGLLLAWIVCGVACCLAAGGRRRALALGVLLGPAAVMAAAGVPPLPWWALSSAFPALLVLAAVPAAAAASACRLHRRVRAASAAALVLAAAGLPAVAALHADATAAFPRRVGYPDARAAAAVVAPLLEAEAAGRPRFEPGRVRGPAVAAELRRRGASAASRAAFGDPRPEPAADAADRLLTIRDGGGGGLPPAAEAWLAAEPARQAQRWPLPRSEVLLYERVAGE